MTTSGMGLSPNINIADQYVENLLKQIHFLKLEVKLMFGKIIFYMNY